jgi:hypothetical protein
MAYVAIPHYYNHQVLLVLAEIIQGGLVLETNINEIASCGECKRLARSTVPLLTRHT